MTSKRYFKQISMRWLHFPPALWIFWTPCPSFQTHPPAQLSPMGCHLWGFQAALKIMNEVCFPGNHSNGNEKATRISPYFVYIPMFFFLSFCTSFIACLSYLVSGQTTKFKTDSRGRFVNSGLGNTQEILGVKSEKGGVWGRNARDTVPESALEKGHFLQVNSVTWTCKG